MWLCNLKCDVTHTIVSLLTRKCIKMLQFLLQRERKKASIISKSIFVSALFFFFNGISQSFRFINLFLLLFLVRTVTFNIHNVTNNLLLILSCVFLSFSFFALCSMLLWTQTLTNTHTHTHAQVYIMASIPKCFT